MDGLDAPQVGLEPTTLRLTAECSAIELLRNMESGGDLLSRAVTSQVPSALKGLTSVFGMGTGGTPSSLPPEMVNEVVWDCVPVLLWAAGASPCRTLARPRSGLPSADPSLSVRIPVPFGTVPQLLCSFRFTSLRRCLRTLTTAQCFDSSLDRFFVDLFRQATRLPCVSPRSDLL